MTDADDTLLVQRSLEGDRRAFEALVDKYQAPIYNIILRMVHDGADAQDVVQDVFLKAFEKLHTFDPGYRFFSWLCRIAVNTALNFLKRRDRFEPLHDAAAATEDRFDEEQEARKREETVQGALMDLSADYRAVIVLRHFQDLNYTEIAHILNITEKKVKSRLFTARMMLREILHRKGADRYD